MSVVVLLVLLLYSFPVDGLGVWGACPLVEKQSSLKLPVPEVLLSRVYMPVLVLWELVLFVDFKCIIY